MRIIAGDFRGRHIVSPEGHATRPMLDRVREALFSTLGARVEGARVLDLFAGAGSLGLEALSRGASHVRFVERDPRALRKLRENVELLDVGERTALARGDALDPRSWVVDDVHEPAYELVFLDPPYSMFRELRGRRRILAAIEQLLAEGIPLGGLLVLHARPHDLRADDLPGPARERVYGRTSLWYLEVPQG